MSLATLRSKHAALAPVLTERSRRVWAATEARAIGHGGIALVERATGISRSTIQRGIRELKSGKTLAPARTRKAGAGRTRATATDETLLADLDALQRSPELTRGCSPEVDHSDFPPLTRASVDAHEEALLHLPPLVCARPTPGSSPACLFGSGVSERAARKDPSLLAST